MRILHKVQVGSVLMEFDFIQHDLSITYQYTGSKTLLRRNSNTQRAVTNDDYNSKQITSTNWRESNRLPSFDYITEHYSVTWNISKDWAYATMDTMNNTRAHPEGLPSSADRPKGKGSLARGHNIPCKTQRSRAITCLPWKQQFSSAA
jgi:hypothetical protein